MLKLIFIGDKEKNKFNIEKLGLCRLFYKLSFDDNRIYESLQPYLILTDIKLSENEMSVVNSNILFACLENKTLYLRDEIGQLYKFDIKKYEKDKKSQIVSEIPEKNPIPIEVTIETKDKDIIYMMNNRGCKLLPNKNGLTHIVPSTNLKYNKKFLDELIIKSIKTISQIKTSTGSEKVIQIALQDLNTKKSVICDGKLVYSFKEQKSYIIFNYNEIPTYYDIWFDNEGKIINDWQTENHNKLKNKNQSNRIYIWNI